MKLSAHCPVCGIFLGDSDDCVGVRIVQNGESGPAFWVHRTCEDGVAWPTIRTGPRRRETEATRVRRNDD